VGTFAVQRAKAFGAEVTGVCSTTKTELVRSLATDRAIDYTREDFAEVRTRYDVILDIAGNRSLSHLRRELAPRGDARDRRRRRGRPVVLEPAVSERATHVEDSCLAVDVALLERHPLAGPQSPRGREEHRRPVARPEPHGELVELSPGLERSLLGAPTLRVVDSLLGRVGVDHSPDDCACQHLPQRLGCLETVPGGDRHPPGRELLRAKLGKAAAAEPFQSGDRTLVQPRVS
jgi:hypothetical protein